LHRYIKGSGGAADAIAWVVAPENRSFFVPNPKLMEIAREGKVEIIDLENVVGRCRLPLPTLKAPGTKRSKLECDDLHLNFAFNFNLRRYNVDGQVTQSMLERLFNTMLVG
jgi:hypothetical protein